MIFNSIAARIARSRKPNFPKAEPHVPLPEIIIPKWFYQGKDGDAYGPATRGELVQLFRLGEINERTLILATDGTNWVRLSAAFHLPSSEESKRRWSWFRSRSRVRSYGSYYEQSPQWDWSLRPVGQTGIKTEHQPLH